MAPSFQAFADELEKISAGLSKADERKQMLQFSGLGAAAIPMVNAISGKLQSGKAIPAGVRFGRWLPAQALKGAFLGGAIPAARHFIERGNVAKARARAEAAKELKQLAPGGVEQSLVEAVHTVPKIAAISDEAKRMGALTAFGGLALPASEAMTSKIRTGRFMGGTSPKRWLLSQVPQALLWGAAFPAADVALGKLMPFKSAMPPRRPIHVK